MEIRLLTNLASKRLISYLFFGGLAFLTEFLSFLLIYNFIGGKGVIIAQTLSFLCGLVVSFTGSRVVTFKEKGRDYHHSGKTQMLLYLTVAGLNLVLSNLLIYGLVHFLNIPPVAGKITVMGMVALWNYTIFNRIVFKVKA